MIPLVTPTYLVLSCHFHDIRFSWWIGLLAVFIDMIMCAYPKVVINK